MKKFLALMFLVALSMGIYADQQVSGVVVDGNGDPVIGASIQAQGSTQGTISDYDGKFEMSVPESVKTLVVSFVGMTTKEVAVGKNIRVVMSENTEVLQDVVVTGYSNVSKGSFAGSAVAVDAEKIEKKSPSEVTKALAGEVAGVQVVNTSGQPGTNASVRIRGIGSIYASSSPLYVVDGVPYQAGDIASIDPSDIASTTILKDATATSLYGSRGANGVIVITTKKGTSGEQGKIDVDVKYGANMHLLPMYDVITSPTEYVELVWQSIYNSLDGSFTSQDRLIKEVNNTLFSSKGLPTGYNLWDKPGVALINGYTGKFNSDVQLQDRYKNITSWKEAIFRVGQKADATVRISGGTEKVTYFASFGYLKDEGYYIGSDFDRFTVRSNIEYQPKKWLKGKLNLAYTYSSTNAVGQGGNMNNGFAYVNEIPPIYPVFVYGTEKNAANTIPEGQYRYGNGITGKTIYSNGYIQIDPKTGGPMFDYGMYEGWGRGYGSGINPAGSLVWDRDNTVQHNVTANAELEFQLYEGLKFKLVGGLQYLGALNSEYTNAFYGDAAGLGRVNKTQYNLLAFDLIQQLSYNKVIDSHTIDVYALHESNYYSYGVMYGGMNHVASTTGESVLEFSNAVQMSYMGSYRQVTTLESWLANASYWYDERYGITANYRADGSSKFAKGHRWGHFGSVGFSWKFTNEHFMEGTSAADWLKNGKLRVSWGANGNQGISNYLYQDQYSIEYVDGEVGYVWDYKGANDISWERTQVLDVGLEFDISKYLTSEIDFFYKYTDNLLMPKYTASSQGYTSTWVNGGSMSNIGVEFQFDIHAVDMRNVKFDIRLNGGHYHNKVLTLPEDVDTNTEMLYNGGIAKGFSLYDYNMPQYAGVDAETGKALYVGYYDANLGSFGYTSATERQARGEKGSNYISNVYLYRQQHPEADIQTTTTELYPYAGSDYLHKSAEFALEGGIGFDLEVYGVTLSVMCPYRIGGYGIDYSYAGLMNSDKVGRMNWHTDIRNAWSAQMTDAEKQAVADLGKAGIPRLSNGTDSYANSTSDRFLISNSYFSLYNVRLGYKFPKKLIEKIKMNSLELYVTGDNIAIATARRGYNPMTSYVGASDSYQYTPLTTIMGGIKFQF
jgi:TonB-linked SusC/RagA family outer membrane protein